MTTNAPEEVRKRREALGVIPSPTGRGLKTVPASTIAPEVTRFLWYPYVPEGMITIIAARGGQGKGIASMSIAAAVSSGGMLPDGSGYATKGAVLWCETEDPQKYVLVPRLIAAGANLDNVLFVSLEDFSVRKLRETIEDHDVRLVVLSPITSWLTGLKDTNGEIEVRNELMKLQATIDDAGCAVIGLAHLNKKTELGAVERVLGSVAFGNFVRSVLLIDNEGPEPELEYTHRVIHPKHNCSPEGRDLIFETQLLPGKPKESQYVRAKWWTAPDKRAEGDMFKPKDPSIRELILETLQDAHKPMSPKQIAAEIGKDAGSVRQALKRLYDREDSPIEKTDKGEYRMAEPADAHAEMVERFERRAVH